MLKSFFSKVVDCTIGQHHRFFLRKLANISEELLFHTVLGQFFTIVNYTRTLLRWKNNLNWTCIRRHMNILATFFKLRVSRNSSSEVFLGKCVPKIYSKFTGEQPCQSLTKQLYWNHTSAWVFPCMFLKHLFLRTRLNGCFWVACPLIEKVVSKLPFLPSVTVPLSTNRFAVVLNNLVSPKVRFVCHIYVL